MTGQGGTGGVRVWALTEQPGREVTSVRELDHPDQVWFRIPDPDDEEFDRWAPAEEAGAEDPLSLTWSQLIVEWGPLTDATGETP